MSDPTHAQRRRGSLAFPVSGHRGREPEEAIA